MSTPSLEGLRTPALLLDEARMQRNVGRMRARAESLGVTLRPHLKTAKSLDVAHRLFDGGSGPITVSTLREAEYFVAGGFDDLLYAVGLSVDKLPDIHALRRRGAAICVVLDHPDVARAVAAHCADWPRPLPVLIEIDSDGRRAGITPDDPRLGQTAARLEQAVGITLRGVLTHAGGSYGARDAEGLRDWARREREAAVAAAETVRQAGHACPVVSVGSTPTACFADHLEGVTELRAGVFVFQDLYQAGLGVCAVDDIAISVLATVISHRPEQGWLIVDAGGLALSKDRSTASQPVDLGFGRVCSLDGRPIGDLIVARADQEHGIVVSPGGHLEPERLPLGSRVRILPNHACMTAAAHDRYHVLDGEGGLVGEWFRVNGW